MKANLEVSKLRWNQILSLQELQEYRHSNAKNIWRKVIQILLLDLKILLEALKPPRTSRTSTLYSKLF